MSLRADRGQRGDPPPLARPAGRRVGDGRPAGQRGLHRLAGRSGDLRALAPPRPGLVPRRRPRPDRAGDRAGLGRLHRAAADPELPQADLCREPPPIGPGRRAARRRLLGGDRLGVRPRPERLLLARATRSGPAGRWSGWAIPRSAAGVFQWLAKVRGQSRPYSYWFQKYTIDGGPEWETPAVDQTALIPWGLERHYRRTGDLDFVAASWPMIEQAARGLRRGLGASRPALDRGPEPDQLGGDLGPPVRGLPLLERLRRGRPPRRRPAWPRLLEKPEPAERWEALAKRIWEDRHPGGGPGVRPGRGPGWSTPRRAGSSRHGGSRPARPLDRAGPSAWSIARRRWRSACSAPPSRSASCPPPTPGSLRPPRRSSASTPSAATPTSWPAGRSTRRLPRRASAQRVAQPRRLQPGHALDGPLPDPLGSETGAGPALDIGRWPCSTGCSAGSSRSGLMPGLRSAPEDSPRYIPGVASGVWGLHAMLDRDHARPRRPRLRRRRTAPRPGPGPARSWPHVGLTADVPLRRSSFRLERPIGGTVHHLSLTAA